MHKSGTAIGFWSAVSIGIGSMVGAGIFALLGEAGAITSGATYISFFMGGVIALLSGYSMGKLGAKFPSVGGIVEYLGQAFGKPIRKSREGLVISGFFIILIAAFLDLGEIAVLGSISILIVHFITHVGHIRLIRKTEASMLLVVLAALVNLATIMLAPYYESTRSPHIVTMIIGFLLLSFLIETGLQMIVGKKI